MRVKRLFLGYDLKKKCYTTTDKPDKAFDDNGAIHADYEHNVDSLKGIGAILAEQHFDIKACAMCGRPFYAGKSIEAKCYGCRTHPYT